MNRIVLDTNVLVSALLANGPPAVIADMVAEGKLIPFYNDQIISEYWDVLHRQKFGFHSSQVVRLIDAIARTGIAVETEEPRRGKYGVIPMPDEDDRKFYYAAKASRAFLITGNKKHFPDEPFIISPADFLKTYQQEIALSN